MEMILHRAGLQTTVQDLGRVGFRGDGVPLGGAMDRPAARLANLLVGNEEGAPLLEFTLVGPELEFSADTLVAVTGADFGTLPLWRPVRVPRGTRLAFHAAKLGCRGYLAVAGGFQVTPVLGSASTFLRGGFGGYDGRALRDGDVVRGLELAREVVGRWHIDPELIPASGPDPVIRVVRGAHAGEFDRTFLDEAFTVTTQSDRMGLRLKGPRLGRRGVEDVGSAPVVPGTVQVPPAGEPIVLMADAQTIGGYPQLAHVISADLPRVAQARPGEALRFREVPVAEAQAALLARERGLAMVRHGLATKFR